MCPYRSVWKFALVCLAFVSCAASHAQQDALHFVQPTQSLIQGKPVLGLQGFDRHADYPGLGKSQPDELADREIKLLHDKGFRIFRTAHYPTTEAELNAADKYGMLVLEEINVTGFSGE